jgi:hypothetical protein
MELIQGLDSLIGNPRIISGVILLELTNNLSILLLILD